MFSDDLTFFQHLEILYRPASQHQGILYKCYVGGGADLYYLESGQYLGMLQTASEATVFLCNA